MPIDYGTNEIIASGNINLGNIQISGNTIAATNTNGNIIVQSNGTGALQRDSGGNARGQYAVDLQIVRSANTQVAAGDYSVVGGGSSNTASGNISTVGGGVTNNAINSYTVVGGGLNNNAIGYSSTVGGGVSNTAINSYSAVGGGYDNTASGNNSTVGGGRNNTASGSFSSVGGGRNNTASNYDSNVSGGRDNTASGNYSTVNGGTQAVASLYGEEARSSGKFNIAGDAQTRKFILRNKSQGTNSVLLYLNGSSYSQSQMIVPENASWFYSIRVIGRNADDVETAAYEFKGAIERSPLLTAILGDTKTIIHEDNPNWDCYIDTLNDETLSVYTICDSNQNDVYWVAYAEIVQVIIPSNVPSYS